MKSQRKTIMSVQNSNIDVVYEQKFWLQIIGDHLRFIVSSLDSNETQILQLKEIADQLLNDVRNNEDVIQESIQLIKDVNQLKKRYCLDT